MHSTAGARVVAALAVPLALAVSAPAQQPPKLALQGAPYFDGDILLTVTDPAGVGEGVWLLVGLHPQPLRELVPTGIGPWAIGTLLDIRPLGIMPAGGRFDVPFNLGPEHPALIGVHVVVHVG